MFHSSRYVERVVDVCMESDRVNKLMQRMIVNVSSSSWIVQAQAHLHTEALHGHHPSASRFCLIIATKCRSFLATSWDLFSEKICLLVVRKITFINYPYGVSQLQKHSLASQESRILALKVLRLYTQKSHK